MYRSELQANAKNKFILDIYLLVERIMIVAEYLFQNLINQYGKHQILIDQWYWYPYASKLLKIEGHLHHWLLNFIIPPPVII